MLNIVELSYEIGNQLLFDHASLKLKKGEIVWLQGGNGSGKTTFLKILANLIHPENIGNELNISIDQQEISLDELKYHLTFIPANPYLFNYLTGNENIEYLMSLFDLEDEYETIKKNLINYSLQNSLNDKVLTYSLGMKAKLFLAVMLEKPASLLLIDELLNNIDKKAQKFTFNLLEEKAKKQGLIILLTSHVNLFADKQVKKVKIVDKKLEVMQ